MGTQADGDCFHTFFNPSKDLLFSASSSVSLVGMQCTCIFFSLGTRDSLSWWGKASTCHE